LPVRERSAEDLLRLSKEALSNSGHQEYSMLSLCVSDYTSLHDSVRSLNEEHSKRRASLSFPSQRADRMNLDIAEELKAVRKSGITLAPEAGTERLRAVINKGLSHQQIISAIEAAYQSGWTSIKLYFMCCLPTEQDEDLKGIIEILKEATMHCRAIKKSDPAKYRRDIEFTCTISNFVPKPFTPFQWFAQVTPEETRRKHQVLRDALREARLKNVTLNVTEPQISLLEAVISRGDRQTGAIIYDAWRSGCTFDAWDDRIQWQKWHESAAKHGVDLKESACGHREVGSDQPWDIVHIGLNNWWLVKEWEKAMSTLETPPCTENLCHACGVCTELDKTHALANPKLEVMKRNPFVKALSANDRDDDSHPSLFFMKPQTPEAQDGVTKVRFQLSKLGDLRFISHLDLQTLISRAARRAFINVAYSKGFNPQPKLNLAAALPLFQESQGEVGEIELAQSIDPEEFRLRINRQLPEEVQLTAVKLVLEKSDSLAAKLSSARYAATLARLEGDDTAAALDTLPQLLQKRVQWMLSQESVYAAPPPAAPESGSPKAEPRDIRAGILALCVANQSPLTLEFEIAHGSKLHVKPSELLSCVQPPEVVPSLSWRVSRLELKAADGTPLLHI
jgi:radical SAM-linked protein